MTMSLVPVTIGATSSGIAVGGWLRSASMTTMIGELACSGSRKHIARQSPTATAFDEPNRHLRLPGTDALGRTVAGAAIGDEHFEIELRGGLCEDRLYDCIDILGLVERRNNYRQMYGRGRCGTRSTTWVSLVPLSHTPPNRFCWLCTVDGKP